MRAPEGAHWGHALNAPQPLPFTLSHAAAALPFMRGGLVPSALVIGSMAPDLPYYLPLPIAQSLTHSTAGVGTVDLLLAVVCFAIWQVLFAPVAVAAAPEGLRRRLAPRHPVGWRHHLATPTALLLAGASLLIGSATHVLWDEFTHAGRWGAANIDWLATTHGALAGYRWAQYASGIVGLIVVAIAAARWWRHTRPMPSAASQRIAPLPHDLAQASTAAVAIAATIGGVGGFAASRLSDDTLRHALYVAATWGGGAALLASLATALLLRPRVLRRPEGRRATEPAQPQ